ncbi:MAG: hypothetical protein H7A38_03015 [Chlamydiales bacterium]|nr:hypothetical protein [Chlamydiales bacterium]
MTRFKSILFLGLIALITSMSGYAVSFKDFSPSVWTNYTNMSFDQLSQEEKTHKLQTLFADQVEFCRNHNVRRAIIRILDPGSFAFFNVNHFNRERDDNFLYWASRLAETSEVEVVFDASPFHLQPLGVSDHLFDYTKRFFRVEGYIEAFPSLVNKLLWVSMTNDLFDPSFSTSPLIQGITIDPKGLSEDTIQIVINELDQYKYNVSDRLPTNHFSSLRTGMIFNLDQRNLALSNLARFPISTDIRPVLPEESEIICNTYYPSQDGEGFAPEWRSENNSPLLDTAYLNLADHRLVDSIYQNTAVLADPTVNNEISANSLANYLSMAVKGVPFIQGPGKISIDKGTNTVKGKYTFFRTGTQKYSIGKFVKNGILEVRPPFVATATQKRISEQPSSNKDLKITSAYSTVENIEDADYFMCPTPTRWDTVRLSNHLASKIYYVFSTEFTPPNSRFFGNWEANNFYHFLYKLEIVPAEQDQNGRIVKSPEAHYSGFINNPLLTGFEGPIIPGKNLVIYDFTTIPNGYPYPECDWELGNKTHK